MTVAELKESIKDITNTNKLNFIRRNGLLPVLESHTCFLNTHEPTDKQRLWHILHDVYEIVKCPVCGVNPGKFSNTISRKVQGKYVSKSSGYIPCSDECRKVVRVNIALEVAADPILQQKRIDTTKRNHGVENASHSPELVAKQQKSLVDNKYPGLYKDTAFLDHTYLMATISQRLWHKKNNVFEIRKCTVCNENPARWSRQTSQYISCSEACRRKLISLAAEKSNNDPIVRRKINDAIVERHGEDYAGIVQKAKITSRERYGVDHPMQLKEIRDRVQPYYHKQLLDTIPEGYEFIARNVESIELLHTECSTSFSLKRGTYDSRKSNKEVLCINCHPLYSVKAEIEIFEFLNSIYHGPIIKNDRNHGMELDFYLPEFNLGIEHNGLYYHSEKYLPDDYHFNKYSHFKDRGIRVLQIFEDTWQNKKPIVKSIISGIVGSNIPVYARKCEVRDLRYSDVRDFVDRNHLQGMVNAAIYSGLFYEDRMVEMMSFACNGDEWSISRLCTEQGYTVIGGAQKLFRNFIRQHEPKTIITYSDLCAFTGSIYEKLGMTFVGNTTPGYFYCKGGREPFRLSRESCMKHKLVESGADPLKTEHEIMHDRGYFRVYNAGNAKFIWNRLDQ